MNLFIYKENIDLYSMLIIFYLFLYKKKGSLGCWSHLDPITARLKGLGVGLTTPTGQFSLKDVVYQDAGTYKCIGQSTVNKKKLEILNAVSIAVKGMLI